MTSLVGASGLESLSKLSKKQQQGATQKEEQEQLKLGFCDSSPMGVFSEKSAWALAFPPVKNGKPADEHDICNTLFGWWTGFAWMGTNYTQVLHDATCHNQKME